VFLLFQNLVEFYERNKLDDSFPDVVTTLRIPYKKVASMCEEVGVYVRVCACLNVSTGK
jgi:hypothetical protein